jgi:hypothetical protein
MLKHLLKKHLRQLLLATETSGTAETPWQAPTSRPRMNGPDVPETVSDPGNGYSFWVSPREVLTIARAVSGM